MGATRYLPAEPGGDHRKTREYRVRGARRPLACCALAGLLLVLGLGTPGKAQDRPVDGGPATSGVVVNVEVLNELGRVARAGSQPLARQAGAARKLLPPPKEAPRSRLLVRPVRLVRGTPPAKPGRKPLAALIPRKPPGLPAVPPATDPAAPAPRPEDAAQVVEAPPPTPAPPPPPGEPAEPAARETARETDSPAAVATLPPPEPARPLAPEAPEAARVAEAPPTPPPPGEPGEPTAREADGQAVVAIPPPPGPARPLEPAPPTALGEAPPAAPEAPRAQPGATQSAALPPVDLAPGQVRLIFAAGTTDLSEEAKRTLETLAAQLRTEGDRRLQLLAYASGAEQGASKARRLSLSRALAVRTFLVEKGIPSRRIDLRPLGTKFEAGPADRVDVVDARR
jgi:outer membrane protein OmpA-like peptidoglycan-associated protein